MTFKVSIEELMSFHSIDRKIYSRLVVQLRLNPALAMWVMGLWLSLEELGYPSVILPLSSSTPDDVLMCLFHEAVSILNFLPVGSPFSIQTDEIIPRTYHLMGGEISLQELHKHKDDITNGIVKTYHQVCTRVFSDILPPGMAMGYPWQTPGMNMGYQQAAANGVVRNGPLVVHMVPYTPHSFHPGFRPVLHFRGVGPVVFPSVQGQFQVGESSNSQASNHEVNENQVEMGEPSNTQAVISKSLANEIIPERTLFMTFSRGYPISEEEMLEYFRSNYGDVIQVIDMEESAPGVEPLWAHVVFHSISFVDRIMNGDETVKLEINGKPAWARGIVQV